MLYDPKWEATAAARPKTTKEILIAARNLIEKPENWYRGEYACTKHGQPLFDPLREEAYAFCINGAVAKAMRAPLREIEDGPVIDAICRVTGMQSHRFNDQHTHAEVLAAFDKAIAAA